MKALLIICLLISSSSLVAQTNSFQHTIFGRVLDQSTQEELPFAEVSIYQDGVLLETVQTDYDGRFQITGLDPINFHIRVTFFGCLPLNRSVLVTPFTSPTFLILEMLEDPAYTQFQEIERHYGPPSYDASQIPGQTFQSFDLSKNPSRH